MNTTAESTPTACENAYTYRGKVETCFELFNCCNCGDADCGCRYCFSCNACDFCKTDDTE